MSNHHVSNKALNIEPFHVVSLITRAMELEKQGKKIVNLVVGEPEFKTPKPIIDSAIKSLEQNKIRYSPSLGKVELRESISKWYQDREKINISYNKIAVTSGSSAALLLTMAVLLNPGNEVIISDPSYPCNRHFVTAMEGIANCVPVDSKTNYQLNLEKVKDNWTEKTKAVLVSSPSNPTGGILDYEELEKIYSFVCSQGGYLIVDEIYRGISYDKEPVSATALGENVFVINSFSKFFCMTGWRLGWLVAPEKFVEKIEHLAQNLYISNSDIAQDAALSAFSPDVVSQLDSNLIHYKEQKDYLMNELLRIGFKIPVEPKGAFYIYADASNFTDDAYKFCWKVLEDIGVAIAPGLDFGDYLSNIHVRFSFPKTINIMSEGIKRIDNYLAKT